MLGIETKIVKPTVQHNTSIFYADVRWDDDNNELNVSRTFKITSIVPPDLPGPFGTLSCFELCYLPDPELARISIVHPRKILTVDWPAQPL
jgi:hypothetical protein